MHRSIRIVLAVATAALAAAPSAAAAPALRGSVIADDMATLSRWSISGRPSRRALKIESGHTYAIDGRALRLGTGGSIRRALPPRPWSLSLDVRMPRHGILRIDLGGEPLVLQQRADGTLVAGAGESTGATLPRGSAGPGGWHHVEMAGFDPVDLHVDGTRVPNQIRPGRRIGVRTLRRTADLTGLVATRRDDRRALLLHRLASIHARAPARRFPIGSDAQGRLRFEDGPSSGFWPGSLWRAYALTGARLFRDWGEKATWDQFGHEPPPHVQQAGLRFLESSGGDELATCRPRRGHRCRVIRKSVGKTAGSLFGMTQGNPGTWALPTVIWPNRCATCASADEVEIRIDSMMDIGIVEQNALAAERSQDAETHATAVRRHAETVARLLVREDGSTIEAVRANRLDGTVLGYPRTHAANEGSVWARGQAGAIYGFARSGLALRQPAFLATAERAARYLESRLPPSPRIPPDDLASVDGQPWDTGAGALAAAGLLRLSDACERIAGVCADGARWDALGRAVLDAVLARVSTFAPLGVLPEDAYERGGDAGEHLLGADFALEAIARAAR
ncbi:MAG TPA: hypothetical protein VF715_19665 [Thermoleophilaceae bacterium]